MFNMQNGSSDLLDAFNSYLKQSISTQTVFLYNPAQLRCWSAQLLQHFSNHAAILLWNTVSDIYLKASQNNNLLVLACLPGDRAQHLMDQLALHLQHMRQVKVLLEVSTPIDSHSLLKHCMKLSLLNVAIIYSNFPQTLRYYTYQAFPTFQLQTQQFSDSIHLPPLYPDKLLNMHRHIITSMPDQAEPYTIVYHDRGHGAIRVIGLLWYMLEEFARSYNATLRWRSTPIPDKPPNQVVLRAFTRNGSLDIAAAATFLTPDVYYELSYPVLTSSWCIMLPMEHYIAAREALAKVFQLDSILLLLGLSAIYVGLPLLLSLLNQRPWHFANHALYRLLPTLLALQLFEFYSGYLQSFLIHPMHENRIESFKDLQNSQVRIWGYRPEFYMYDLEQRIKYASVFHLTDSAYELIKTRNALNVSYAYTVTSSKWRMYAIQQQGFRRPIFRYSNDVCIQQHSLFSMMVSENLIYLHKLNLFFTKMRETGFTEHFIRRSFYDMVQGGKTSMKDLSESHEPAGLSMDDYRYVFTCFGLGLGICLCIWLLELIVYYMNVFLYGHA